MEKAKKKRVKRALTWTMIGAVVLLLTLLPLMVKSDPEADGPVSSVLSATVESGSIQQVINGGGTLSSDTVDVKIPEGVRITEFLVRNGDHVTAGTPVAAVDKVSVLSAMSQVEETLDYLRNKIESAKDETLSSYIYATAGGRVKKVFAQKGESVQDVMLRDGCLALLSVDGKMAVKFEGKSDVTTGQDIAVTLADGSVVTGQVKSNLNGEVIVTVTDEGYEIGTSVTVEGLGQGELYVHSAWKATAISGTISTVYAAEEKTVSAGASLFVLTETAYTGQWEYRMRQHQEYEELLQTLSQMYHSATIDAPCDGVISGVEENSAYLLSANQESGQAMLLSSTANTGTVRLMLLSSVTCTGDAAATDCQAGAGNHVGSCPKATCARSNVSGLCEASIHWTDCVAGCTGGADCLNNRGYHREGCVKKCTGGMGCQANAGEHDPGCYTLCNESSDPSKCPNAGYGTAKHKVNCIHKCTSSKEEDGPNECKGGKNHYTSCIESCDSAQTETAACDATGTHKKNCIHSCLRADATGVCRTGTDIPHHLDCVESCTAASNCPAAKHKAECEWYGMTYKAMAAKVDSVGNEELVVYWDAATLYDVEPSGTGWKIKNAQLNESLLITSGTLDLKNVQQAVHKGDIVLYITAYKNGAATSMTRVAVYKSSSSDGPSDGNGAFGDMMGNMAGGLSGMTGDFGGNGNYTAPSGSDEGLYDLDGDTLLTVIQQETMTISITLDEQDIGKVSLGMEAEVKVEARPGKTYKAVISDIGVTGENNGGNSKFAVELTLEADQDMLDGMSTTVQIILATKENIPVIPLAALNGDSVNVYVYTALDKETGDPANPVEVKTGLSDEEQAEILSGLNIGDTVYYRYYDVLELDTSA